MYTLVVILILIVSVLLGLIVLVVVLCLFSSKILPVSSKEGTLKSEVSSQIENMMPNIPATEVPATTNEAPAQSETPAGQE